MILSLSIKNIGKEIKNIWDTTIPMYKSLLTNWYKGTGGGPGLTSMFESWSDEQFDRFGIQKDNYDHTNIKSRHPIMASLYDDNYSPYLTFIFMHDSAHGNMLCSKYEPLATSRGEFGINGSQLDIKEKGKKTTSKVLTSVDNLVNTLNQFINNEVEKKNVEPVIVEKKQDVINEKIEDLPLKDLLLLSQEYQSQLKFLVQMDLITPDEKEKLKNNIMNIFSIIDNRGRQGQKRSFEEAN